MAFYSERGVKEKRKAFPCDSIREDPTSIENGEKEEKEKAHDETMPDGAADHFHVDRFDREKRRKGKEKKRKIHDSESTDQQVYTLTNCRKEEGEEKGREAKKSCPGRAASCGSVAGGKKKKGDREPAP